MKKALFFSACFFLFFASCRNSGQRQNNSSAGDTAEIYPVKITHASGFSVRYSGRVKKVTVNDPAHPQKPFAEYVLVQKGEEYSPEGNEIVVNIPFSSFASVSTTHLSFITLLKQEEKLTGFSGCRYVKDTVIGNRIKQGKITEIGFDYDLDMEKIIDISPEAIVVYPYEGMNFSALEKAGIKIIYNAEYFENTPLGKAEWIKFMALFFNKEKEAEKIFSEIEKKYNEVKSIAASASEKPLVFSGKAHQGKWHIPGGKSFAATFLYHAGARYPWSSTGQNNVLEKDFEEMIDKAQNTDWWVITGSCNEKFTLQKLLDEDERYRHFNAFKNKKILFCNVEESDYFGKGIAEPHIILSDLIYYFHPGKLNGHKPAYFFPLE